MVDLHLEGGAGLVVEVNVHLLHARAELAEKGGQEHVELVRLLVGGDQYVGNVASILVDLGLGVELVHHNILVLLVPEELKVAVPLREGSEDPVLADDHLVEEGLGVQLKVALKPDLQLVGIVHLGGDSVVLPHHGTALGGHDVNVPSAGASIGRLFGIQLHAPGDVRLDDEEASPLVVDGEGDGVLGNVEPFKQVGGTDAELVWRVDSVSRDVDDLLSVLDNVKVDLELAEEEVPVVPVNEELEVVGPGLESAEGIVVLDELVQLGGGVEGHLGVGLPDDGVGVGLVLPQGLVGPHGLAVLGGLDLDGSAQVQFNLKLVWRSLKGELVVLVVGLEVSLGNLAAHDGVLAPQSELGALHLNLALQLDNALRTLLDVDDNVGLIRSTLHTDLTVVLDSPDVSLDDDVHVLAGPVEGALDGGGHSAPDDDGLDALAGLADDVPGDVTAHIGVLVLALQLGCPVRLQLKAHVVDPPGDDGSSREGVRLSLNLSLPHASLLLPLHLHGALLHTGAILVLKVVVKVHLEEAVSRRGATLELGVESHLLALGLAHKALEVLDLEVGLATLGAVGGVGVLDAHFGADEGHGELLEAGAVDVLNMPLGPHAEGLHVGVGVGDELLHQVHHGLHVKVLSFRKCGTMTGGCKSKNGEEVSEPHDGVSWEAS